MVIAGAAAGLVQIDGENALVVERLREPLSRALGNRRAFYRVRVETLGRVGEVLVSILGRRGRIPLLFASSGTPSTDWASEVMWRPPRINEAGAVARPGGVVRKRCVTRPRVR
jgi:hypothetical protein